MYEYAAAALAARSCVSLKRLFKDSLLGSVPFQQVEEVLETTGRALGSLYAEPTEAFAIELPAYYLERWAPDFEVMVECTHNVSGVQLLTLNRSNPDHFSRTPSSKAEDLRRIAESPSTPNPTDIVMRRIGGCHEVREHGMRVLPSPVTEPSLTSTSHRFPQPNTRFSCARRT